MKRNILSLLLCSLLSMPLMAAENQHKTDQKIEHIKVSADFNHQDQQSIPTSVSVVGKHQIAQRQAQVLAQILNLAPNVNFDTGASRGRFVQIRGIGERSQFAEPLNPSVDLLIDDVDFTGQAAAATLFDVQQVEILKGPQATEFGAAALAGAIHIKTTEPGPQQGNLFSASLAQQNSWRLGGAYGKGITNKLFYRVAVEKYKSDGFIHDTYLNRYNTNGQNELTSRFKLKYLASDDLTVDLSYQFFDINNGYDAFSLENNRQTRSDQPGFDRQKTHALSLKAYSRQSWGNITAIGAWSKSDMAYGYDEDWTYVGFDPNEYSSFDAYYRTRETRSIDLRAQSNPATVSWVIGLFAKGTNVDLLRQYTYNDGDFTSQYAPDNRALYGQVSWQLSAKNTLIGGLRLDHFSINYQDNSGFSQSLDDTIIGGKLVVQHQLDDTSMLYAGIHRGYKAGGFNPDQQVPTDKRTYAPEYNWNYEVGYKTRYADDKGVLRVSAFYMQRKNTQIADYALKTRANGSTEFIDIIANADNGTNKGIELESRYQLTSQIHIFTNIGLLRADFSGYRKADGSEVVGRDQSQAPHYSFNLGADWQLADNWQWHISADGKDKYYFSDSHNVMSNRFILFNSRLSYTLNNWQLSLWGKNLFDRTYYTRGFGGFNNDPRENYGTPKPYYQLGDGRRIGLSAEYHF